MTRYITTDFDSAQIILGDPTFTGIPFGEPSDAALARREPRVTDDELAALAREIDEADIDAQQRAMHAADRVFGHPADQL